MKLNHCCRWILLAISAVTTVVTVFILGCGKGSHIYIAGNLPLSGPIAIFSGKYPLGFKLGIEDACKKLGISVSKFKLDFQDNQGKPTMAAAVMRKQLLMNPQIYISGTSQMSEAIIPEVSKRNIPHFLVSFDTNLNEKYSTAITILPNFKLEAPLFVRFIVQNHARKVFFFTPNLKAYLEQSNFFILPELKKRNIEYKRELFDFHQRDFRSLVIKAINYHPDVIIVSGYAFHVYPIIKLLKQYNIQKRCSIMATLDYIDLIHKKKYEDIKGVAFTSPLCEIPGRNKQFDKWKERFKSIFKREPSYVDAYAYDTAWIIVATYKKFGNITVQNIIKVLPFDGIVGRITIDENRVLNSTLVIGYLSEDGRITQWKPENRKFLLERREK